MTASTILYHRHPPRAPATPSTFQTFTATDTLTTLASSNTFTGVNSFRDSNFSVVNASDATKQLVLSLGNNTTGRVITLTTNQTSASPTLNIPNITLSGDSIACLNVTQTFNSANTFTGQVAFQSPNVGGAVNFSNATALMAGTQAVASSGNPWIMEFIGGAHTNLTTGAETFDVLFNFNRIVQHATGAITNQRSILFEGPTYSFVGASTITNAATLAISNAPAAGTNATITNSYALWVQAGKLQTAASGTASAGFNLLPGVAPTSPVNGDVWSTTTGVFAQINGSTVGPFGSSSATIGGSIANTQVAYGSGSNTIQGSATMVYGTGAYAASALILSGDAGFESHNNSTGSYVAIVTSATLGNFIQFAKDVTPTHSGAVGMNLPGFAAGNNLVLSTFAGSWVKRVEIASATGDVLIGGGTDNGTDLVQVAGNVNVTSGIVLINGAAADGIHALIVNGSGMFQASITTRAPINIGQGTAPAAPVNGDIWISSAGVFAQVAGATVGPFGTGGGGGSTFLDGAFEIQNTADTSKLLEFNLALMATGQVLTIKSTQSTSQPLTIPNITTPDTLVTLGVKSTFVAEIVTAASATGTAGFNLPPGIAPTAPVNGDVWTTTIGVFAQINGSTVGPFSAGAGGSTFLDSAFAILNAGTPSKQVQFSLTGSTASTILTIATAQAASETLNIPNITATDTIATLKLGNAYTGSNTWGTSTTPIAITQGAATSGNPPTGFSYTGGAHTGLTAGAATPAEVLFNGGQTKQWTGGTTVTSYRFCEFDGPVMAATSATTFTSPVTLYIAGPPTTGANATVSAPYAFKLIAATPSSAAP